MVRSLVRVWGRREGGRAAPLLVSFSWVGCVCDVAPWGNFVGFRACRTGGVPHVATVQKADHPPPKSKDPTPPDLSFPGSKIGERVDHAEGGGEEGAWC